MLKECSAVLYLDAVWVLYATLLCVLSFQANCLCAVLSSSGEEGQDEDEGDAGEEVAEDKANVLPVAENGN